MPAGAKTIRSIVQACSDRGIKYLTLFAFSTENWKRPADEVSSLMRLLMLYLQKEVADMNANGVRLRVIGDTGRFSSHLRDLIVQAHDFDRRQYPDQPDGGRQLWWALGHDPGGQGLAGGQSGPAHRRHGRAGLQSHLCMAGLPEPDLLIRTGGEARVSNFMLWQMAYTELYFTDVLWPDFDRLELDTALASFAGRDRRFGTSGAPSEESGRDAEGRNTGHSRFG